jgi:hypothetical protein
VRVFLNSSTRRHPLWKASARTGQARVSLVAALEGVKEAVRADPVAKVAVKVGRVGPAAKAVPVKVVRADKVGARVIKADKVGAKATEVGKVTRADNGIAEMS